jgi:ankyrin repeat protein
MGLGHNVVPRRLRTLNHPRIHVHRRRNSREQLKDDDTDLLVTGEMDVVSRRLNIKCRAQRLSMVVDQLFTACDSGNVNNASRLLAALPEVNLNTIKWSKDEGELTLLTHTASNGHAEICQMLLDKGADVNQRSEGVVRDSGVSTVGVTPLIYACWKGRVNAVQIFLAVDGIDVNYRKDNGVTALLASCAMGHFSVVKMLLAADDIQVNQADDKGYAPLNVACQFGHLKVVGMLLAVDGIQVNQADDKGYAPLNVASQEGHSKVVKMLLAMDGIQVNQADGNRRAPLYVACQKGHSKVVRMLLAVDGIQVNQATNKGWTPLNSACFNGHSEVVQMLLAVDGIQVNQAANKGTTPLSMACQKGHLKVVNMLLAVDGIQVNQMADNGATPLNIACQKGHSKVVKMLLAADGIEVNQAANHGWAPLIVACQEGHSKVVEMLLAADGIQVNQANDDGMTPFMSAVSNSHSALVILLLQRGFGHNNINEWFHVDKPKVAGRITLYKYALILPQQHQPLLDFHLCLLNTQHALVPTSSLKAFSRIWPQLVAFKIESFLLPTKQTRRTMQKVISYFNETLNDTNTYGQTQLYEATSNADVDSVRFLVQHEGILVDQLSKLVDEEEDEDDQLYETPLNCAVWFVEANDGDDEAMAKRIQIVELLREAGGTAREIPREEWLAEENALMVDF